MFNHNSFCTESAIIYHLPLLPRFQRQSLSIKCLTAACMYAIKTLASPYALL